jgi:glycolate oxidase FAD binding subunit
LRHRYGSLRDLVIGMTIVLADGTIARSGGRVVKNVAGYDLCKLLTGSLGTLAVITEATFRLHPLPQHTQTFTVSAPQAAQLAPLMASIRASQLLTQALQLRGDANGFHLDIQLNAHPESHQDKILQKMTEAAGLRLPPPIASQGENERGSGLQAAGKPALQKGFNAWPSNSLRTARARHFEDESAFTIKVTLLPSELATACERILELGGHCVAQANGILLASFPAPGHTTAYNINTLREEIEKHGGSLVVLKYAAPSWSELSSFGRPPDAFPLMQAIKQQFDPNKTLNHGRLLGGI